jgi:hypothetical protein
VFEAVAATEARLHVLQRLQGFAIAADHITAERGQGAYHLIVLDSTQRTVTIRPYAVASLEQATVDYAKVEQRSKAGEPVEAVLVSAGPIAALRQAYPNYFLDTRSFVTVMNLVINEVAERRANKRLQRTAPRRRR